MKKPQLTKPLAIIASALLSACAGKVESQPETIPQRETPPIKSDKLCISGVYPHLAWWNNEGECGTGAVVPWACTNPPTNFTRYPPISTEKYAPRASAAHMPTE